MAESGLGPGDAPVGGSRRPSRPSRSAAPADSPDIGADARDYWPSSIQPVLDKTPDEACPWLYLHADPDARASFVTADHRCEIRSDEVPGPGHQLAYCLSTNHISCPQLRSYEARRRASADVVPRQPAPPAPPAEDREPALAEFRASMIGAPTRAATTRRGGLAVRRFAWAAIGAVGALIFAAGLAFYAVPDNASSDGDSESPFVPGVSVATATPSDPLAVAPFGTATPNLTGQTDRFGGLDATSIAGPEIAPGTSVDPGDRTPTPEPAPTTYVVGLGDTLGQIAERLGIDIVALAEANDMTTNTLIYVNDVLLLPQPQSTATATSPQDPTPTN